MLQQLTKGKKKKENEKTVLHANLKESLTKLQLHIFLKEKVKYTNVQSMCKENDR